MTAVCGGGTSAIKPGVADKNVVAGTLITAGLEALSPWLAPVAGLVDGFLYDATQQCSSDPPPMPTFDATDFEILALGLLAPTATATLGKVHDLLLNYLWYQWCQCTSIATPPRPAGPPAPQGAGSSSAATPGPCFTGGAQTAPLHVAAGTAVRPQDIYTTAVLPVDGRTLAINDVRGTFTASGMPAGVTSISYSTHSPNNQFCFGALGVNMSTVYFLNASGGAISSAPLENTARTGQDSTGTITIPANTSFWYVTLIYHDAGSCGELTEDYRTNTTVYCGGGPGVFSNCCPPDPSTQLGINTIIQLIQQLQSGGGRGGYTKSTVHTGLTGSGSLTVSGLAGVLVDITAAPPTKQQPGNPPYIWDMGWISILTGDGMIDEKRLTRSAQIWMPPAITAAVIVGYYLNPGVTATLTELVPA